MKAWWVLVMVATPATLVAACGEESNCPAAATTVATGAGGSGGASGDICNVGDCDLCLATSCARDACAEQVEACDADVKCAGFQVCIAGCGDMAEPEICAADCIAKFPGGEALAGESWLCMVCDTNSCFADCGGSDVCDIDATGTGGGSPTTTGAGPATTGGGGMASTATATSGVGGAGGSGGLGGLGGSGGSGG